MSDAIQMMMDAENRRLRAQLVFHRIAHGISRKTVAERLGVSKKSIKRLEKAIESGEVHLSTLRRYYLAIGVVVIHRVAPLFVEVEEPREVVTYPAAWCLRPKRMGIIWPPEEEDDWDF